MNLIDWAQERIEQQSESRNLGPRKDVNFEGTQIYSLLREISTEFEVDSRTVNQHIACFLWNLIIAGIEFGYPGDFPRSRSRLSQYWAPKRIADYVFVPANGQLDLVCFYPAGFFHRDESVMPYSVLSEEAEIGMYWARRMAERDIRGSERRVPGFRELAYERMMSLANTDRRRGLFDFAGGFKNDLRILFTSMPLRVETSVPSLVTRVRSGKHNGTVQTGGAVAKDYSNRVGIITSAHGLTTKGGRIRQHAWVNPGSGPVKGEITTHCTLTDSCFVCLPPNAQVATTQGANGPSCKAPSMGEIGTFHGVISGQQKTKIMGHDPILALPIDVRGKEIGRIYTTTCTEQGDSGAALVNDEDYVVGFARSRTGAVTDPATEVEFSIWSEAEATYRNNKLQP